MSTFCGYIALLGRPNAGKSTLINACVGQKIVGVSKRPQTTRNKVVGIDVDDKHQFVYLDTPGIHKSSGQPKINQMMNKTAWSVLGEADCICYLIDSKSGWHDEDENYLKQIILKADKPVLVLATKIDSAKKDEISESIKLIKFKIQAILASVSDEERAKLTVRVKPFPVSAKRPESVKEFKSIIKKHLPSAEWLFPADDITDKPEKFVVAEMIREQLFRLLGQELPYGTTVVIDGLKQSDEIVHIKATIVTSRATHKPMIIGKAGEGIKRIGTQARVSLERHFEKNVFLELYVKLAEGWVENTKLIAEFQQMDIL